MRSRWFLAPVAGSAAPSVVGWIVVLALHRDVWRGFVT
jgi:hypothetical protein